MDIHLRRENDLTIVELIGDIDSAIAIETEESTPLNGIFEPGCRIVFDLSRVGRLSGFGLRSLLLLYRKGSALGTVTFSGAPQHLHDLIEVTGFGQMAPSGLTQVSDFPAITMPRIDIYPTHHEGPFALRCGRPLPLGALPVPGGINFSVFSQHAKSCTILLFMKGADTPAFEILVPDEFRIGYVFCLMVFGLAMDRFDYGFRLDGPFAPTQGHRFDPTRNLLDPYARCLVGRDTWGIRAATEGKNPYRSCLVPEDFDWQGDRPLELPIESLVIYEVHLRGFTASPSSGVKFPGTYAGFRQKIPYLKQLGVNCVELLPIFEFDECENTRINPQTREPLVNYWGYSTIGFWAPKASYAATASLGMQTDEFKALIKELHTNGIEIILDVVFNHTAEGDERGPTLSFRGLDNKVYYLLTPEGHYHNFSGCGNTLNCNHPIVRDFVVDCLRHWVSEYHIDGFRFDLASILGRDQEGHPLPNPPLLETLAADPVLGKTKLIAEAWDAGGLYQVGSFPDYGRWAEWNGKFRDAARRFLKGDAGLVKEFMDRVVGSPDLYHTRGPTASINFITCHDGFTLLDLVSYNQKHNEANGEHNRDGGTHNDSWNCGVEGPTDDPKILGLRRRQIKNALAMLFLSQGVPMLLMGDECGRTQQGNNNAYCHDGPLTWFDWNLIEQNAEIFRFCQLLIRFRQAHDSLGHPLHVGGKTSHFHFVDITWHGTLPNKPDVGEWSRVLAFTLRGRSDGAAEDVVYIAMNMYWEPLIFGLPGPPEGKRWYLSVNTGLPTPEDIHEVGAEVLPPEQGRMTVGGRSIVVLVAK